MKNKSAPDGEFKSDFVFNGTISDTILSGQLLLPQQDSPLNVAFHVESEPPTYNDFEEVVNESKAIIDKLTPSQIKALRVLIAEEITDSAYSQMDYKPTTKDYKRISDGLELTEITFFGQEAMLIFEIPDLFPDQKIYVQIDHTMEIDDIIID